MCHSHIDTSSFYQKVTTKLLLFIPSVEEKPIIYTYGNISIDAKDLVHILQPYRINCVVDCRPEAYTRSLSNTPSDELQQILKQNHIIYLPFSLHFGVFPNETRNKNGTILYSKVIKSPHFLKGIERLQCGVQKGYSICIIDFERYTAQSKRYTILGKFLKEQYNICHIFPSGTCFTQEQVTKQEEEYKYIRKQKKQIAQKIGETGEELAALYLSHHGYQILDHNWNLHRGCELDLVAMKNNTLHFIEVKTRTSDQYGEPQVAINWVKMKHISQAIQNYRYRRGFLNIAFQIDSIAIIYRADNDYDLKHFLDIRQNGSACADVITYQRRPSNEETL